MLYKCQLEVVLRKFFFYLFPLFHCMGNKCTRYYEHTDFYRHYKHSKILLHPYFSVTVQTLMPKVNYYPNFWYHWQDSSVKKYYINRITQYILFLPGLFLLDVTFQKHIHVVGIITAVGQRMWTTTFAHLCIIYGCLLNITAKWKPPGPKNPRLI